MKKYGKRPGANRWFILAGLFLLVNGYGVFRLIDHLERIGAGVRVTALSRGEGRDLVRSDEIRWEFSGEMAGPDEVYRWMDTGPVRFTPKVPGHFCWETPARLVFIPEDPWVPCRSFLARLEEDLTARDGRPLTGRRVFEFTTGPLRLLEVSQVDISPRREASIRFEFNAPVSPDSLTGACALRGPGDETIDWRVEGSGADPVCIIKTGSLPAGWEKIILTVKEGLESTAGPAGLEDDLHREVAIEDDLALFSLKPRINAFTGGAIEASFSTLLDLQSAVDFLAVEPEVDLTIEESYSYGYRSRYLIRGDFEPGRTYTLTIRKGLRARNGSRLTDDIVRNVYFPDRPPALGFKDRGHYLSAGGSLRVPVTTVNIDRFRVEVERIYPNNLVQFAMREADNYRRYYGDAAQGLTRRAAEEVIEVSAESNRTVETLIDLRPYLRETPSGAFWITVDAEQAGSDRHLVVVTDTGISVKASPRDWLIWANSIRTLEPVSGAEVRVYSRANQEIGSGVTDQEGLAHISRDGGGEEEEAFLITVTRGEDISYLALDGTRVSGIGEEGGRPYLREGYQAYLFTERGVYRPGETALVSAIVRGRDLTPPPVFPVSLRLIRPDGKEDRKVPALLSAGGTAAAELPLADYAMTGRYRVDCLVPGVDQPIGSSVFLLEEFVPPRIEVEAAAEAGRAGAMDELYFTVAARHLFGPPAAGNPVTAWVEFQPRDFTPAGWDGYVFGEPEKSDRPESRKLGSATLSRDGEASFLVRLSDPRYPPAALSARFGCSVTETGGRAISAYASRTIDPYPFYIGLRMEASGGHYPAGQSIELKTAAVLPDGSEAMEVRDLEMTVSRITWSTVLKKNRDGRYAYLSERQLQPVHHRGLRLDAGRGKAGFTPTQPGRYLLKVEDPASGSSTSLTLDAGSPDQAWIAWSMEHPERVDLSLDRERYRPGDTAVLIIRSPFPGRALVTVESDRILERRVITLSKNTAQIPIAVKTGYGPNVYCTVSVIRPVLPGERWAAHRAAGSIPLLIDRPENRLDVIITTPEETRPKERLTCLLAVTDQDGAGVEAEVTMAAVDEGICGLTGLISPDPFGFFLGRRELSVALFDIYALLMAEAEPAILPSASEPGGGGPVEEELRGRLNPVSARRFRPVSLRSGWVKTDETGRAEIEFDLPEFTGELRLMAVAVAPDAFGSAEEPVTVKRSLIARSSLPRFLAPGDRCRMAVRVFNQTGRAGTVRVEAAGAGGLLVEAAGNRVETALKNLTLPNGGSGEVEFELISPPLPGLAAVRLRVELGDEIYEETTEFSVRPPAPPETRSGVGLVRPGESVEIELPEGWFPGTAHNEIRCSGLPGVRLTGSLTELLGYPYGCIEQTVSRSFPLLYLADLAGEIIPGAIGPEECSRLVEAGIARVLSMQLSTGGFSYWPSGRDVYEWGSIYAAHFLVEAERAGYDLPAGRIEAACSFLSRLLDRRPSPGQGAAGRGWRDDRCLKGYACLVLARAGRPNPGWTARLAEEKESLDRSSRLYLAGALLASGRKPEALKLLSSISPGSEPEPERERGGCLRSGSRDDAASLSLWLDINPDHPAVPVLVRRLSQSCRNGSWRTTQENAIALMALGRYCRHLSSRPNRFRAVLTGVPERGEIPFGEDDDCFFRFAETAREPLRIRNNGPGTVYYSWSSEGVPAGGAVKEEDRGIAVRRRFLDTEADEIDISTLRRGDLVVVEITVDAGSGEIDNLVITDLLPAGLEIENAALKTSRLVAWTGEKSTLPLRHTDIRDDRLIAFTGSFSGKKSYYYLARAVTPGLYIYPPVSAECMYDSDLRSVSGVGKIRVEL